MVFFDHFLHLKRHCAGQRVAGVGVAIDKLPRPIDQGIVNTRIDHHTADGLIAAAQPLGHDQNVGGNLVGFTGK